MNSKFLIIASVAAMLSGAIFASAQEKPVLPEEAKSEQTGLKWFVGCGLGFNSTWDYENKGTLPFLTVPSFAADLYGGAWLSSQYGFRVGYYGIGNDASLTLSPFSYRPFSMLQNMIAADLLFNIGNPFAKGDKPSDWSFVPYIRIAADIISSGRDENGKRISYATPAAGLGCLVMWAPSWLGRNWSFTVDDRFVLVSEKSQMSTDRKSSIVFPFAITIGLNYRFE